ncbi:hypothetical protein DVH24_008904 [Malus domestica]|uniref:Uncharacterized protein n=1 Tax=Malus domestica TaxID=3750 RepID=A0A498JLF8_MALDO|nr:hypothetical protein DVH24_008904 [Malus domestica]
MGNRALPPYRRVFSRSWQGAYAFRILVGIPFSELVQRKALRDIIWMRAERATSRVLQHLKF